jgi:E3 ubiquitin-protein ligase SHPRH
MIPKIFIEFWVRNKWDRDAPSHPGRRTSSQFQDHVFYSSLNPTTMRETCSTHVVPTTAQVSQLWESDGAKAFRPNINLRYLTKVIRNTTISDSASNNVNGKRKAPSSVQSMRRTKRTKTFRGSSTVSDDDNDESDDCTEEEDYPVLELQHNHSQPDTGRIPILRHVLNIQYTKNEGSAVCNKKWDDENKKFQAILSTLSDPSLSLNTIELGDIRFAEYRGSAVAMAYSPHSQNESNTWLFIVPSLLIDGDSNDLGSSSSTDLLLACRTLQGYGQAYVEASLKLVVLPLDAFDNHLPFTLQLEFVVSLVLPLALDPAPLSRRAQVLAREDARRRLLRATYLSQDITSLAVNEEVTVSKLYSSLGSAPPLPSERANKAMQPASLVPTLLPFQRRSVAWMLEKEGMVVNEEGLIVPQKSSDNFSFWKKITQGDHTWYLHRLSGELSAYPPDTIPAPFGGILAEEPGLGKTVETIALILLNPAPPEYNPTMSRWDPQASLEVKAVKVSSTTYIDS